MAKQGGLGSNFYIGGYDLSGDVASLDTISGPSDVLDVTAVKQLAHHRIYGARAAAWSFTSYFEFSGTGTVAPGVPGSGTPIVSTYAWPVLVTVSGGTVTNVTVNGVSVLTGDGSFVMPGFATIVLTYSAAPTWTWTAFGTEHNALSPLPRADVVANYFIGTAVGNASAAIVAKQIDYDPTRDTTGNLTLKCDLTGNSFGMEWGVMITPGIRIDAAPTTGAFFDQGTPTTTAFGAQAYLQLFALVGTNVDVSITHATTSGGSYTSLIDFGSLTTAPQAARASVSNATNVNEFLKVVTTGTFTYAEFAVMFVRNPVAGVVF